MQIHENISLKKYNTFGIDVKARYFVELKNEEQIEEMSDYSFPSNIQKYISGFDSKLSEEEFINPQFGYRIFFIAKTANRKGQADRVIEFIKSDSDLANSVNQNYTLINLDYSLGC